MEKKKISGKLRRDVFVRDNFRCLWCGRSMADGVKLHADHVFPESLGGETTFENLGTLCEECNISKSNEYFGDYLLTTLQKSADLWNRIEEIDLNTKMGSDGRYYDGRWYKLRLVFFKLENDVYRKKEICNHFLIPEMLLISTGDDVEIRISKKKEEALLQLKQKVKDFLFENKGFLRYLDSKLIFEQRP